MNKKIIAVAIVLVLAAALSFGQETIKGMSMNGSTGLIATPTAQIGWERSADIGVDAGLHLVFDEGTTFIPKVAISLFKKFELAVAYDSIGADYYEAPKTDPYGVLVNGKFQLFNDPSSAVAIGGNFQYFDDLWGETWTGGQVYVAATYSGQFFKWPAATTMVIGKSFSSKHNNVSGAGRWNLLTNKGRLVENGDIDFSMGFELTLLPEVFKNYVQWINDFANYSYSLVPAGSFSQYRGAFNTGVRIDPLKGTDFKFVIDAIVADVFDHSENDGPGRSFVCGVTFGMALK